MHMTCSDLGWLLFPFGDIRECLIQHSKKKTLLTVSNTCLKLILNRSIICTNQVVWQ